MSVSIIAAIGNNRVLGQNNELLWHISDDMKQFKTLTLGHPVIMGRKTFESIVAALGKPLPGRTNIIVTRNTNYKGPSFVSKTGDNSGESGFLVSTSIEDAIAYAKEIDQEEIFVIGGGQIYAEALPLADRLYLTLINDTKVGDTFFPAYENEFTKVISEERHEQEGLKYSYVTLER